MAWSEIRNGVASDLKHHSGLWAVKGDRVRGLDVKIGKLATLRIKRAECKDHLVWDVFLDDVKDGAFRMINHFK